MIRFVRALPAFGYDGGHKEVWKSEYKWKKKSQDEHKKLRNIERKIFHEKNSQISNN